MLSFRNKLFIIMLYCNGRRHRQLVNILGKDFFLPVPSVLRSLLPVIWRSHSTFLAHLSFSLLSPLRPSHFVADTVWHSIFLHPHYVAHPPSSLKDSWHNWLFQNILQIFITLVHWTVILLNGSSLCLMIMLKAVGIADPPFNHLKTIINLNCF